MRPGTGAVIAIAGAFVALTGCHLYIDQDDDEAGTPDAGRVLPDARSGLPDGAVTPSPDADTCITVDEFLTRFGECMSWADWQATGMCDVPSQPSELGPCTDCHADGTGGILLAPSCMDTFEWTRVQPYILGLVRPSDDDEGCFNGFASGSWLTYGAASHPSYTFSEARARSINDFFGFTYARYADPDFDCAP